MDNFSAFLPHDRRVAISEGGGLPDRVRGAALFADISGFTPLTATLRHELGARRGAEEVIHHVDAVFAALIDRIQRYGGSVIAFSGDAITCWFDDADSEQTAAPRAVAAALELQEVMTHIQAVTTPAGTVIPLAIKVAIAAGPARRFLAGDPQTYVIEVIAGRTVDRMAAAEKLAQRGEVVAAAEVVAALDPPPVISAWRSSGVERLAVIAALERPPASPAAVAYPTVTAELARPWLLPPVYANLRQGAAEFLAELRPAVPMFVKFGGIDFDGDDAAGDKLDALVRRVQGVLDHYEGFLIQITTGDKGSYLYICFGAPVAHENDTQRAAAAALELREAAAGLGFLEPLQIGISRGLVHSGAYGGDQRRTFAVMGNEVNISARLMSAARPGQILISGRVAQEAAAEFDAEELPPIMLKGMDEPFALYELRGRRAAARAPRQLPATSLGRDAERAMLDAALAELAGGRSATLIIEGAAGTGKSLLMRELVHRADGLNAVILSGGGDAIERATPYFGWRPICEGLFSGIDAADSRWLAHISERLDPQLLPLLPLLNVMLPLDLPDNELTGQMTGEVRQENTQQLMVDLLRATGEGAPLILLFDDAHWLDSASWSLIGRVQREMARTLLVIASRSLADDLPAAYLDLRAGPDARLITLDSLPRAAIAELVGRRLGVERVPPEVERLIYEKAEGNPFFSEELAYALRDSGLLLVSGGEARVAPGANLAELDFPTTIQGVITSRIDRLSASQQLTVKVASVIGRIFAVRVLDGVYPLGEGEALIRQNLKRLERLDITPEESPEPDLAYIFKHIVTHEVVYSLMTYAQRRQLHQDTALWFEATAENERARNYPLLAHHWRMAGNDARAVDYYEKAAEDAFRAFANQEAIHFFEQALELGADQPRLRRARWRRLLGETRYRLTQIEGSIAEYEAALELLGRPLPPSTAGRGAGLARALARQVVHRVAPGRFVGSAPPDERAALLEASRALEESAEYYYNLGDFLTSFYCTMNAFNLAERAGPSPGLMRCYANMCATLGVVSLNSAAEGYRKRALALEPQIDDLPARAWSRIALSTQSVWVAKWDRAEREITEALDIYKQLGDWRRWGVAAWLWPQVAQSRGELERARELWAELHAVAARSRDTRHEVRGRGGQFFNFLSLDRPDEAFACLEAMQQAMEENPEMMPVEDRLWYAANAAWALREGDAARAAEMAAETLAAIGRARFKFDLLEVFATPAEVLLALWEQGAASPVAAKEACKVLSSYARTYAFARPRALRVRGQYNRLAGSKQAAEKLWAKSLAQADALDMPHERVLTMRVMG